MSVHVPADWAAFGRGRGSRLIYDQATEPAFADRSSPRSARLEAPGYHPLARWLAVGALALVTIVFLLIVLQ